VHEGWNIRRRNALRAIDLKPEHIGGHAFALVGYTPEGFIVQNSWGPGWGFHGFAVMTYADWVQNGMDAWVAVLGAAVQLEGAVAGLAAYQGRASLRDVADTKAGLFWSSRSTARPYEYENEEVEPWSAAEAQHHAIVMGNDGRPINRLLHVENAEAAVRAVSLDGATAWLRKNKSTKVAIYAHGGLNDEDVSIARVRVLGPYFRANGIYPIFLTWRTGLLESIHGIIEDALANLFIDRRAEGRIAEFFEQAKDRLDEAKDRAIEAACEKLLVKAVWSQMKQNAEMAARGKGGTVLLAENLLALRDAVDKLEIHLVGHSAGSIILGHLLSLLVDAKAKNELPGGMVSSTTLYAPACSVGFACRHYIPAVENKVLGRLHVDNLTDGRERADTVAAYGKSLLYLVSRALEVEHKTPLLGMQVGWQADPETITWSADGRRHVEQWLAFAGQKLKPAYHDAEHVSNGVADIPTAHGSFDNDVKVVTATLKRILRSKPLRFPVENLHGY
jgi:hypothetical protein